ncbi:hypothetical protein B6S12_02400 [Helicobacter valdiviensis]|uniref:Tetratricopeptide repeat protein n=1 Tax=Helicobacter valdiviensis TaxID=1458358 RepID=A0A2W6PPR1_9HELI|nr:tetratricopeptide repeat protein [Helicobacter valdiviensis]PZT48713.1 hypothetical protein B6S12_02400 [Helicobacter valdiviensis]
MAVQEGQEQVIRLDDSFDILEDVLKKDPKPPKPKSFIDKLLDFIQTYKKLTIFLALLLGVLIVALIFVLALVFKEEVKPQEEKMVEPPALKIQKGADIINNARDLEELIKKANFLYTSGNKVEALDLYGKISNYSEGLSNYNLGVAQMNEKSYKEALGSFQKAIDLGEDRVISALNAAVCSLMLGYEGRFGYYTDLAQSYLPSSGDLALYSYLYALTHYYKGNYLEAISPLLHPNSEYYQKESDELLAMIFSYLQNDTLALERLSKYPEEVKNWFNMGILYARIGEYQQAQKYLLQAIEAEGESFQKNLALELVMLKDSQFESAGKILDKYAQNKEEIDANPYPIMLTLQDKFFDVNIAQNRFWNSFKGQKLNAYKLLYYFAPYKVFDAKEAFNVIQEGGLNIHIENLQEAKDILLRGQTISRVNKNIADAILQTLNGNIREANKLLTEALKRYPNHSILHYDLGLNYAQMGDFNKAYEHFLRSFHLNPKDLQAGIFALMSAQLTFRDYQRLDLEVSQEIAEMGGSKEEQQFILTLLNFVRDGVPNITDWLDIQKSNLSIYHALDYVLSVSLKDKQRLIKASSSLRANLPRDPIANLLELLAINFEDNPKELSLKLQSFYRDSKINKDPIYYGASVVREMYIQIAHIAGTLHYVEEDLDKKMISEQKDVRGVIQALALTYIYLQEFEKAFTLYNSLLDDFKEEDTQTYFLAAIAAVGAGHIQNASTLLQLSKLEAPTNYETRIAIGILYQQEKNFKAAATQFRTIGDGVVSSEYFDFKIDSSGLLNQK